MPDVVTPMPIPAAPRTLTLEDVHKVLGGYVLELELLRRENAALREQLAHALAPNGQPERG